MSLPRIVRNSVVSAAFAGLVLFLASCATPVTVATVPEDLSPAQLFQRAQDEINQDNWENARAYVMAFKERFPDEKVKDLEADYLLAQLLMKEDRPEEALAAFKTLLARFDEPDAQYYPQWVKILCVKLIHKLEVQLAPPATPAPAAPAPSESPVPAATPAS